MWQSLFAYVPLLAMLVIAAAIDCRQRRIPNWLTLIVALTGVMQSFGAVGTVTPGKALAGLALGVALTIVQFALRAVGGGDVKLLAAVGAWAGPLMLFQIFLAASVAGLVIVLAQCLTTGKLRALLKNSGNIMVNLRHLRELGVDHVSRTGLASGTVGRRLPYAVSVLAGTLAVLLHLK